MIYKSHIKPYYKALTFGNSEVIYTKYASPAAPGT